eukprot:scaffold180_cov311-Pinguiococcus_pyrenoidosus.AAC.44
MQSITSTGSKRGEDAAILTLCAARAACMRDSSLYSASLPISSFGRAARRDKDSLFWKARRRG